MSLARHYLAEYYGCKKSTLDDAELITELLRGAAEASKTTLIKIDLHKFEPQGVSGVAILAESHLSIHTWPEFGFASIEIYVCSEDAKPELGDAFLRERLAPSNVVVRMIERGDMDLVRQFPAASE